MPDSQFTLGEHEARIENIERDVAAIRKDVRELVEAEQRRTGARNFAIGVSGALGGLVGFAASLLKLKGGP